MFSGESDPIEDLTVLENRRTDLINAMEAIDVKRRELQARIMIMNRQRNMPKIHIARMKAESAELLQKRTDVRNELGKVNRELSELRRLRSGLRTPETVAQTFVRIAKRMMPEEMFNDIMDVALNEVQGPPPEN
ncbi:MAG: hypothetical protein K8T26_20620 [Lentisphaerae bacterium]|nr:hypothetical protein [Lentisphaerota bacterium]